MILKNPVAPVGLPNFNVRKFKYYTLVSYYQLL